MKYTVFSIDDWQLDSTVPAFMEYWSTKEAKGKIVPCSGRWMGDPEVSFICLTEDFESIVKGTDWVSNQESVLEVSEDKWMYTDLINLKTGERSYLGTMKTMSYDEAMTYPGYTYRPDMNVYWVASKD